MNRLWSTGICCRLKALHIHDNHGVNDDHLPPFVSGGLDWKMFMDALCASGYRGQFNLELHDHPPAPLPVRRIRLEYFRNRATFLLSNAL